MDKVDLALLTLLQQDSRYSYAELGHKVNLSVSAINERIKKLQAHEYIKGYSAKLDAQTLGLHVCAFIQVLLDKPQAEEVFLKMVAKNPAILECHHVAGDYSYLLKVRTRNTLELEKLLRDTIKSHAFVARTHTLIVLSSAKETSELPLPEA